MTADCGIKIPHGWACLTFAVLTASGKRSTQALEPFRQSTMLPPGHGARWQSRWAVTLVVPRVILEERTMDLRTAT